MGDVELKSARANACMMIISSAPIVFYAVQSGHMYNELKETFCPLQFNDKLEPVDVTKRWRLMALFCFITSIIVAATQILGALANCIWPGGFWTKLCGSLNSCAGIAFAANCIWITIIIFSASSKPCY